MTDGCYVQKNIAICNRLTCCDKIWAVTHGEILQTTKVQNSKFQKLTMTYGRHFENVKITIIYVQPFRILRRRLALYHTCHFVNKKVLTISICHSSADCPFMKWKVCIYKSSSGDDIPERDVTYNFICLLIYH